MRLIDADALKAKIMMDAPDFMDGGSTLTKVFILAMIDTRSVCPTIDAVPVIRCQNCEHWIPGKITDKDDFIPPRCRRNGGSWSSDEYCSNAEPKGKEA